jgi:hypothetical protein
MHAAGCGALQQHHQQRSSKQPHLQTATRRSTLLPVSMHLSALEATFATSPAAQQQTATRRSTLLPVSMHSSALKATFATLPAAQQQAAAPAKRERQQTVTTCQHADKQCVLLAIRQVLKRHQQHSSKQPHVHCSTNMAAIAFEIWQCVPLPRPAVPWLRGPPAASPAAQQQAAATAAARYKEQPVTTCQHKIA